MKEPLEYVKVSQFMVGVKRRGLRMEIEPGEGTGLEQMYCGGRPTDFQRP